MNRYEMMKLTDTELENLACNTPKLAHDAKQAIIARQQYKEVDGYPIKYKVEVQYSHIINDFNHPLFGKSGPSKRARLTAYGHWIHHPTEGNKAKYYILEDIAEDVFKKFGTKTYQVLSITEDLDPEWITFTGLTREEHNELTSKPDCSACGI